MLDYSKMLQDEQSRTDISVGDRSILFRTHNLQMQSSLLDGKYPIPDNLASKAVTTVMMLDSVMFLQALERVCLLADKSHVVRLSIIRENTILLFSKTTEIGDVSEELIVNALNGNEITIFFNGKYMMDILQSMGSRQVIVKFSGRWSPIIIQPDNSPETLYILTPIKSNS
ncbi:hypothetical protein K0U00_15380 [Paenibacillus sepulcri]|uniref:DNA polymerase III beta sliding clamp C-terminal domain-containing protein n=1 Tax=Paenibacillus sepulcri TaxID=359917 RepID=A0ABS7C3C5_9BACL|nr:hypothetical protein [Paenibacillus sepulcri]